MVDRILKTKLLDLGTKYPVITLTGPRQSGKTTLLKHTFPDYEYVSLENIDMRSFAQNDPRGFLASYPSHVIIDEVQQVPQLLSYIQTHVDDKGEVGMYMLAGSQNFLLMESINQSLASRMAILRLLPFSRLELSQAQIAPASLNDQIFVGNYPCLYDKQIAPTDFYPYYIQTYVERDVRQLRNIGELSTFVRFVKLCAGRIGQLLNLSSIANECGISTPTAAAWVSVLEASYICYRLKPDWNNFGKRLVKSPKLYFYDTGLACSLLGIESAKQIDTHYLRGGLFENMIINEFIKLSWNAGKQEDLRFWRDSQGNEIDLLVYNNAQIDAYEIKSGQTLSTDYFKGLTKWSGLSGVSTDHLHVIYGGDTCLQTSKGKLVSWEKI